MEQLNRIELRGIVGNVNIQTIRERRMARFSLATDFIYKGRGGEPVIETSWHNVVAWEGKYIPDVSAIGKGATVHVTGRMRIQKYTSPEGEERTGYDVVAEHLEVENTPAQMEYRNGR